MSLITGVIGSWVTAYFYRKRQQNLRSVNDHRFWRTKRPDFTSTIDGIAPTTWPIVCLRRAGAGDGRRVEPTAVRISDIVSRTARVAVPVDGLLHGRVELVHRPVFVTCVAALGRVRLGSGAARLLHDHGLSWGTGRSTCQLRVRSGTISLIVLWAVVADVNWQWRMPVVLVASAVVLVIRRFYYSGCGDGEQPIGIS